MGNLLKNAQPITAKHTEQHLAKNLQTQRTQTQLSPRSYSPVVNEGNN